MLLVEFLVGFLIGYNAEFSSQLPPGWPEANAAAQLPIGDGLQASAAALERQRDGTAPATRIAASAELASPSTAAWSETQSSECRILSSGDARWMIDESVKLGCSARTSATCGHSAPWLQRLAEW